MIPSFDGEAKFDIDLPLTLQGGFDGVSTTDVAIRAESSVSGPGDISNFISNINFEALNLDQLLDMRGVSLDQILDGMIATLDYLVKDESLLYQTLPGLERSAADLFGDGTDNLIESLKNVIEDARGGNLNGLEDQLNAGMNLLLGGNFDPIEVGYQDSNLSVQFDFLKPLVQQSYGFAVDLKQFPLPQDILDKIESVGVTIGDTAGTAEIMVDAVADFSLGFGVDLSDVLAPVTYVTPGSGIGLTLSAANDPLDFNVNFPLESVGLQDLAYLVKGATAEIDMQVSYALLDNDDGFYELGTPATLPIEAFGASISGGATVDLPLFLSGNYPVGGSEGDENGDGIPDNVFHATADFSDGELSFDLAGPGAEQLFDIAALLNDPGFVLEGLETLFQNMNEDMLRAV